MVFVRIFIDVCWDVLQIMEKKKRKLVIIEIEKNHLLFCKLLGRKFKDILLIR